jgi:hypothetical protein
MRRIFFGPGTLVLALATLMWATPPVSAQRGGRGGGGHATAHTGSIHYAAPARVGPPVRAGAVRSEHYAGSPARGAYRNPYSDEYFRHFRSGYRPYVLDGAQYYGYDDLPLGYQQVLLNGVTYYLFDGVYYQPYIYGGQTVYLAVPPGEPQVGRITDINGRWYMGGDNNKPCSIRQRRGSDRALFVNENGSQAEGSIRGQRVFIPSWGANGAGQEGTIRDDRIVWTDGSYWSR